MRVLIDTNIALDFLLQREPFFQDVELLFQAIAIGQLVGYVTATTLTDIFYISRKHTRSIVWLTPRDLIVPSFVYKFFECFQ